MTGCGCGSEEVAKDGEQRSLLLLLLGINLGMFFVEIGAGVMAQSTGLIADSLDMLADAMVYGVALYAVGRSAAAKISAAQLSGVFQILLAAGVAVDVARRFIVGSEPQSIVMMLVGGLALAANVTCLLLISRHRQGEVHMRASWIFSANDVIANIGIIISGALVALLGNRWPDLLVGALIVLLVFRGGVHILRDAAAERRQHAEVDQM